MWIEKLLSNSSSASTKRFISILSFLSILILVGASCFGVIVQDNILNALLALCGGNGILTVVDKSINKEE